MQPPFPSPNWQPAPARTISIPTPTNLRARSLLATTIQVSWAPKSSADNLDFVIDPTDWLADTNDALIQIEGSVPTATGATTDLSVSWASIMNGMGVLFLGGGAPGTTQTVAVSITTSLGRKETLLVQIAITGNAPACPPAAVPKMANGAPIPPNAIVLPNGNILTDKFGQIILIA